MIVSQSFFSFTRPGDFGQDQRHPCQLTRRPLVKDRTTAVVAPLLIFFAKTCFTLQQAPVSTTFSWLANSVVPLWSSWLSCQRHQKRHRGREEGGAEPGSEDMACKGPGIQRYAVLCKANWGQSVVYLQVWHSHCSKSICGRKKKIQLSVSVWPLQLHNSHPVNFDIWACSSN